MVLQKQVIDIPVGGLETKIDPKLVPMGRALTLENAEFSTVGSIKKRNGYTAKSRTILGGTSISAGRALFQHRDELLMFDGKKLYAYASGDDTWADKGTKWCVSADYTPAVGLAGDPTANSADVAIAGGVIVYAWHTAGTTGNISYAILDASTKAVIKRATAIHTEAACRAPRLVTLGTNVVILFHDPGTNNIKYAVLDTTSPTGFGATANLVTDSNTTPLFDAADQSSTTGVIVYETSGNQVSAIRFTSAGTTGSAVTIAENTVSRPTVVVTAADEIFLAWATSANVRVVGYDATLSSTIFSAATIEALGNVNRVVGVETSTANTIRLFWDSGTTTAAVLVRSCTVTNAGTIAGTAAFLRGVSLSSKPFVQDSTVLVSVRHSSTLQSTIFVVDSDGAIAAKVLPGESLNGFISAVSAAPSTVVAVSSGVWVFGAVRTLGNLSSVSNTAGVAGEARLNFNYRPTAASLATNCFISGGVLGEYDGDAVTEHGFHLWPEDITATDTAAGGSMSDGTYGVVAYYIWIDSRGNVVRSAPSAPYVVTVNGGGSSQLITVTIPTLRLSAKSSVYIAVFRTLDGGSTYYLGTSDEFSVANSTTADTVTVNLTDTDATVAARSQLYTTDGTLEALAPPSLRSVVRKGLRLFGSTSDGRVFYSREIVAPEAAAFSDVLYFDVGNGEPLDLAVMDDNLIVFGPTDIYAVSGDGPNDQGILSDLSPPRTVAADVGIEEGAPLVVTDQGCFFRGPQGLRVLNRSLQVDPVVGYPVESFASFTMVSAVVLPEKNQIRFGHSDGSALVFDYASQQWSVFTNHTQAAATNWRGSYALLRSNGTAWVQSSGYTDGDSSSITMKIRFPWLKLAGLQGFQRLYEASILGAWRSSHSINLRMYLDYSGTAVSTSALPLTSGITAGDSLQARHHIGSKCEAVSFEVYDTGHSGTGESFDLAGLALEVGIKKGVRPQGSSRTF